MRPAWLPAQSPAVQASSPRDGVPPRPGPRPRSAATTPPRDTTIHSARQLLSDDSPPPQKPSTAPAGDDETVSLRDFMDSFPLVPLAIIPRLGLADLNECEAGLVALYQSLQIETSEEDAQLAKYVARQLGLVQRHLEQARARDRVLKLLTGEVPIALSSLSTARTIPNNNNNNSSSSKTLPVFLQPQPSPVNSTRPALPAKRQSQPSLAQVKSTSSIMGSSKPVNQLAKAKALAKASTTTAFVITTSETSLKARQKKKRQLQKSKQSIEEERKTQREREKENRRQAAYQRLIARQELQAKKKEEALARKNRRLEEAAKDDAVPGGSGGFVRVTETSQVKEKKATDDDTSSSDESEVSNCSENDAADEQAIMEMPVVVTEVKREEKEQPGDDEEEEEEEDEEDEEDEEVVEDQQENKNQDEDERIEHRTENDEPVKCVGRDPEQDREAGVDSDLTEGVVVENGINTDGEHPEVDEECEKDDEHASDAAQAEEEGDEEEEETEEPLTAEEREQQARDSIALELQRFVAERTQSALAQLRIQHADDQAAQQSTRLHRPGSSQEKPQPTTTNPRDVIATEAHAIVSAVSPTSSVPSPAVKPTRTKPLPAAAKRKQSHRQQPLALSRPPTKNVQDYRGCFANFFCILTSVYEQRVAFASAAASNNSQSSLLTSTNTSNSGDQALRLQLKLYQSWQSIMNDYATVFGNTASSPFTPTAPGSSTASTAHYRINSHSRKEVSDIVVTALEKLGNWEEHASGLGLKTTWNLLWTWSKPNVERKTLLAWQRVNHFQHAKALTRKDCLKKNIGKYLALGSTRLKQAYDIIPASFLLPQEYVAFVQAFQERSKSVSAGKNIWIMKPVALSRGRGISLVNDLSQVVYGEQVVIQEYIANPLLLDGFKFDLRLYVLVTSFNPLEVFFYEEGFVRMCTRAYEDSDLTNLFIHLTNSSIQKENQDAIAANPDNPINSAQADAEAGGTKMTLAYLWKRLEAMGADVASVKNEILTVILKALMCGEDHIPFQVNSFDLYGYDILLDTNFRPWLIEINSSPSMARENDLDFQVKDALIYDTLKLVNPLHFDRSKLVDVLTRRFQEADTDKKRSHANTLHPKDAEELAARQLNEDLTEILLGQVPRAYGEMPEHTGSYTRLAPHTTIHNRLVKLKKSCLRLERK